jgi:hypothetical protein
MNQRKPLQSSNECAKMCSESNGCALSPRLQAVREQLVDLKRQLSSALVTVDEALEEERKVMTRAKRRAQRALG